MGTLVFFGQSLVEQGLTMNVCTVLNSPVVFYQVLACLICCFSSIQQDTGLLAAGKMRQLVRHMQLIRQREVAHPSCVYNEVVGLHGMAYWLIAGLQQ